MIHMIITPLGVLRGRLTNLNQSYSHEDDVRKDFDRYVGAIEDEVGKENVDIPMRYMVYKTGGAIYDGRTMKKLADVVVKADVRLVYCLFYSVVIPTAINDEFSVVYLYLERHITEADEDGKQKHTFSWTDSRRNALTFDSREEAEEMRKLLPKCVVGQFKKKPYQLFDEL